MLIYSEEEWFDAFYPKAWGNWKEFYNMKAYREQTEYVTGCAWMNYQHYGSVGGEDDNGHMKVHRWGPSNSRCYEHFFVECGSAEEGKEDSVEWFIQPYFQPVSERFFASVCVIRLESNLDIYKIRISGCDDSSYSKHFLSSGDLTVELCRLKQEGIRGLNDKGNVPLLRFDPKLTKHGYFFTN